MHVAHCFNVFKMSAFIFVQYIDLNAKYLVFPIPCGCFTTAVLFVSPLEKDLLFIYPSWQFHQSLSICFLMASSVPCCFLIHLSCVASPALCMIPNSAGGCLLMLLPVCSLRFCKLSYLLMCWWCLHLFSSQWFPGLCTLYGCSGPASP